MGSPTQWRQPSPRAAPQPAQQGAEVPASGWQAQKQILLNEIAKYNEEHAKLKEENDTLEADLLAQMPQQGIEGPLDISKVQAEIQRLMNEKASLEQQAAAARQEIEEARRQEQAVTANHKALLKGFKELKGALDADDAMAKAHLNKLLAQLKGQQEALANIQQQEDKRYNEEASQVARELIPNFSQTLKRATEVEKQKTAEALKEVERDAQGKFELAAKEAADRYAEECERVLAGLKEEQAKQDALADSLEIQVKTAEAKLKALYADRQQRYRETAQMAPKASPETIRKLKDLRAGVRKLWRELNTDPERIIQFLESVRRVSPPDEKFYQLLCRTAEQLTAQLAIKQAINQRDEMLSMLKTLKHKSLETISLARSHALTPQDMPAASKTLLPKIDRYLAKGLVKQLRAQYYHVAASLRKVDSRLEGYLRDYWTEFKEDYIHGGQPYLPALRVLMNIEDLDASLPPAFKGDPVDK